MVVSAHDGKRFPLWVARPLAEVAATTASFYQASLSVCAAMAALLFAIQVWQARRLSARIAAVTQQLPRLREGDFESRLPPDPTGDEVAELRDALEEATRQLEGARDRQERLIANAAHEIQTPLACMRTLMDLALFKDRTTAELRQAVREARAEIDRLAALARDLLEMTAAEQVMMDEQEIDLLPVVRASAESFRPEAGRRGLELRQEPAGRGPGRDGARQRLGPAAGARQPGGQRAQVLARGRAGAADARARRRRPRAGARAGAATRAPACRRRSGRRSSSRFTGRARRAAAPAWVCPSRARWPASTAATSCCCRRERGARFALELPTLAPALRRRAAIERILRNVSSGSPRPHP